MTYKDKLQQANKEAKSAVVALFLTVLVWIISGFGVAQFNITIFNIFFMDYHGVFWNLDLRLLTVRL